MLQPDISPDAVEARERAFVLGTYSRTSFHPRSGKGARLVDAGGVAVWDLLGGIAVNALGHDHPALRKALLLAAEEPLHVSNLYFTPAQGLLAERLVRRSGLQRAFFCNSGTEANEAALKFARLARPERTSIVALREGFHGRTAGALAVTGHDDYRTPFAPFGCEVTFVEPNDEAAMEAAVTEKTLAVIVEPVMGEAGIVPLSDSFLQAAARAASRSGALLICDEVQSGLGRTGEWFAFQSSGIAPDMVTLAKPLGGGLPLGAVLVSSHVAAAVRPGLHGTTFGGNPVACRLGLAVVETLERERLIERSRTIGEEFGRSLRELATRLPAVLDVRGRGLMWGIEVGDRAPAVAAALLEQGFLVGVARNRTLRVTPPLVIPAEALAAFTHTLEAILDSAGDGITARRTA